MDNPLAIAVRDSKSRDELYRFSFGYFQTLFRTRPSADVSRIQLPSYLPESVYKNRAVMNAVMTGALVAMLDHRVQSGGELLDYRTQNSARLTLDGVPSYAKIMGMMDEKLIEGLDDIILTQASMVGAGIFGSDLAFGRFLEWQHSNYRKFERGLKAMDKAVRVYQQRTSAPLDDPFLKEAKRLAVEQLRPLVALLQDRFTKKRRQPTAKQIVEAFAEEANELNAPFVKDNFEMLLDFYRRDPLAFLHLSAEKLFDEFAAFTGTHVPEYVRKKISLLK